MLALSRRHAPLAPRSAEGTATASEPASDGTGSLGWAQDTLGNGFLLDAIDGTDDSRLAEIVRDALSGDPGAMAGAMASNQAMQKLLPAKRGLRDRARSPSIDLQAHAMALGAGLFDPVAAFEVA